MSKESKKQIDQLRTSALYSHDVEIMVLGCMISDSKHNHAAFDDYQIRDHDFYFPEHKEILKALGKLFREQKEPNLVFLSDELRKSGKLEKIGGIEALTAIAGAVGTGAYFEAYVEDLREKSHLREFTRTCSEMAAFAASGKETAANLSAYASSEFDCIQKKSVAHNYVSLREVADGDDKNPPFLTQLRQLHERGEEKLPGLSTGFSSLDEILGGLRQENFILIAARPSVGKTAFAVNLLRNLGIEQQIPVAFFSLEMSQRQILLRFVSAQSGVSASKIERGKVTETDIEQIESALASFQDSRIYITDSCHELSKIVAQMKNLIEEHGVKTFVIDYIGLVEPTRSREIKAYEIGDITRAFKNLANEYHLPIVCLAQLNRQADSANRPQLSMLKDSGNLEQDADSVMFLHRRELYDSDDKPGQMEVLVAKNRHGATDSISLAFNKETGVLNESTPIEQPASWNWES